MGILDGDNSSPDIVTDGDSDQLGPDQEKSAEVPSGPARAKDRESQAPEGEADLPRTPRPGSGTVNRYKGIKPGPIKVGYPCKNCTHTHMDHSMYSPRLCLMDCPCIGLIIDHGDIPSRIE